MDAGKVPGKRKNEGKFPGKNHYTNNATVRIQRNQAEKQRRDRLNDQIAQLATLVPPAVNATKPLDKVSILRLSASWMRLNFSCLNEKRFKSAAVSYLDLHHSLVSNLDILEKSINGFIIATTFGGIVLMCSRYSEEYIGYQNIDLLGHHISNFVLPKEKDLLLKKMRNLISKYKNGSSNPRNVIRVRMQQRPLPRSSEMRYRKMSFSLSIHSGGETPENTGTPKKNAKLGRHRDFGESAVVLIFAEPVQMEPNVDVKYLEQKDCYFTIHGTQGEIIFADHRISIMTGYMPRDVLGNSAYQYIHSLDVPIALFAQKAMFESSDGTGMITYRLRIRDSSFIYLQTKGQIRYKDSTREVRQFICCNILLNEEEGRRELKKFQDRYAPQLNASKLNNKEIKSSTKPPTEANVDNCATSKNHTASFEHENLKRKSCHQALNSSISEVPMEMEESNTVENSMSSRLLLDLDKIDRANNDQSHSLSPNSERTLSSTDNSPESFVSNGFHGANQSFQMMNCNKTISSKTRSLNVQSNSWFSSSNNLSPMQSISSVNEASTSFAAPLMFENDPLSALDNSIDSTLLSSDLLLIPDDFTTFNSGGKKTFTPAQKFLSSQSYPDNRDDVQRNVGNITFPNNVEMLPVFSSTTQNEFQNHVTTRSESLLNPDKNSLLTENVHGSINGHITPNSFSTFSRKITNVSDTLEMTASNRAVFEKETQSNLDLSFLDQSVDSMALLCDLSDFYENSKTFMKLNQDNQCQTEAISNSSDTEANCTFKSCDLNYTNGVNSHEPDVLGSYKQISSDSRTGNNAHSIQTFDNYSPHSYFPSESENSRMTNGKRKKTFNADYFQTPVLEQDWQAPHTTMHYTTTNHARQLYTIREGHTSPRKGTHQLHTTMNSQPASSKHAQNEYVLKDNMVNQPSPSVFQPLEGSQFGTLN